jgi:hypothetical protein
MSLEWGPMLVDVVEMMGPSCYCDHLLGVFLTRWTYEANQRYVRALRRAMTAVPPECSLQDRLCAICGKAISEGSKELLQDQLIAHPDFAGLGWIHIRKGLLFVAAKHGRVHIAEWILDVPLPPPMGFDVLMFACIRAAQGGHRDVFDAIVQRQKEKRDEFAKAWDVGQLGGDEAVIEIVKKIARGELTLAKNNSIFDVLMGNATSTIPPVDWVKFFLTEELHRALRRGNTRIARLILREFRKIGEDWNQNGHPSPLATALWGANPRSIGMMLKYARATDHDPLDDFIAHIEELCSFALSARLRRFFAFLERKGCPLTAANLVGCFLKRICGTETTKALMEYMARKGPLSLDNWKKLVDFVKVNDELPIEVKKYIFDNARLLGHRISVGQWEAIVRSAIGNGDGRLAAYAREQM